MDVRKVLACDRRRSLDRGVERKFVFVGERLCLDFINTRIAENGQLVDLLQDFPDWVEWSLQAGVLNPRQTRQMLKRWRGRPKAVGELEAAKGFRESLRGAVEHIVRGGKVPGNAIIQINRLLRHPIHYFSLACSEDRLE